MNNHSTPRASFGNLAPEAADELRERTRHLDELAAELDFFSCSVTHDLRAPLRTIGGFSHLLKLEHGHHLPQAAHDYLRHIIGSIEHMERLVTGMFNLSRANHQAVEREPVDLSALAIEVLARLKATDPHRGIEWYVAAGLTVQSDPVLVRMLLENLIGNAWKYTGKVAGAVIEVGCRGFDGDVVYFVRDNGAGFDMTHVGSLFNPFQRLHNQSDFPGSGVGLTIVRRIVRSHGGRVWAESGGGAGATFHFTLVPPDRRRAVPVAVDANTVRSPILAETAATPPASQPTGVLA